MFTLSTGKEIFIFAQSSSFLQGTAFYRTILRGSILTWISKMAILPARPWTFFIHAIKNRNKIIENCYLTRISPTPYSFIHTFETLIHVPHSQKLCHLCVLISFSSFTKKHDPPSFPHLPSLIHKKSWAIPHFLSLTTFITSPASSHQPPPSGKTMPSL